MMLRNRQAGFTLIELLVVIAIISILASMMFPVFSRARGKGRQAACISNVNQITLALLMYAQDYNEMLPRGQAVVGDPTSQWYNAIFPYTRNRQIMYCPDRQDNAPGYGLNRLASGRTLGQFWDPSSKILIGDVRPEALGATGTTGTNDNWHINDIGGEICGVTENDNSFSGNNWPQRHNDGVIHGYADGHVKWSREEMVNSRIHWDPLQPSE